MSKLDKGFTVGTKWLGICKRESASCFDVKGRLQVSTQARCDVPQLQKQSQCEHLRENPPLGTMCRAACVVQNRAPHYCVPDIVVDQGVEFEFTLSQECEEFGIDVRITGSHAGWQQVFVERHCGLLENL